MRKYALFTFFFILLSFTWVYRLESCILNGSQVSFAFHFFCKKFQSSLQLEIILNIFPRSFHWLPPAFISIGSEIIGLTRLTYRVFFSKQHQANFLGGGKMAFPVCHQSCNPIWAFPVCHVVARRVGVPNP